MRGGRRDRRSATTHAVVVDKGKERDRRGRRGGRQKGGGNAQGRAAGHKGFSKGGKEEGEAERQHGRGERGRPSSHVSVLCRAGSLRVWNDGK